ncbi:MAG: MFS transporter [Corynebacterium nuruki]|nr:MFS transporter [Corynebacterium nuruki]
MTRSPLIRRLTVAQSLFVAGTTVDLTLTGVVGSRLAPSPGLATLPYALIFLTAGLCTGFISRALTRRPPRVVLSATGAAAVASGLVSAAGVRFDIFWLFCLGTALVGVYTAGAGYYRYLAAESTPEARAGAVSAVLAGGLVAAVVGPFLATALKDLTATPFVGSYLLVAVLGAAATVWNRGLPDPGKNTGQDAASASTGRTVDPRPMRILWTQRQLWTGLAAAVLAASMMMAMMTAGPILGEQVGHSATVTAFAVQLHMVGMYAPGLVVSRLTGRIGEARIAAAGAALVVVAGIVAVSGTGLWLFLAAMFLVGVGWNFAYSGGSALIAASYRPAERPRVQAVAEVVIVGSQVAGSLSAVLFTTEVRWAVLGGICVGSGVVVAVFCVLGRK